ncbi:MAG: TrmB family transcriptional regulator [Candidatus Helarchaeota archaeon]
MKNTNKIIKDLETLGFNKNDAIVYLTLLKLGMANPTQIARESKVARPRVYDAISRLIDKGAVIKDTSKKQAKYIAITPKIVFKNVYDELEHKMLILQQLEKEIQQEIKISKPTQTFHFQFDLIKIKNLISHILQSAKHDVRIIIPKFFYNEMSSIIKEFIENRLSSKLVFSLLVPEIPQSIQVNMLQYNKIYIWTKEIEIPFGMILNDTAHSLLIFQSSCIFFNSSQETDNFRKYTDFLFNLAYRLTSKDLKRKSEFEHLISK